MHTEPHCRSWTQLVFIFLILALCSASSSAGTWTRVHPFIQFTVQDQDGNFFPIGEVEFCTPDGQCLYADMEIDFPGHFILPSDQLRPGVAYTVRIYDLNVAVHFEMHDWIYVPGEYDPSYERFIELDKYLIFPRFHGQSDGSMVFSLDATLNPEWLKRKNLPRFAGPDSLPDFPRLVAGFQVPVMLGGKFRTDELALGGVEDVRPGIALSGTYRFGYPKHMPPRGHWVFFQQLTLAYQQNRYETWEIITPGRHSDVTFHRIKLSYGVGQLSQSYGSHWSFDLTVAAGGLYDGFKVLRYLDQAYKRPGIGCRVSWLQRFFQVGRLDVGLSTKLELMYYFADSGPDDYWFGTAPSASFGLVVF